MSVIELLTTVKYSPDKVVFEIGKPPLKPMRLAASREAEAANLIKEEDKVKFYYAKRSYEITVKGEKYVISEDKRMDELHRLALVEQRSRNSRERGATCSMRDVMFKFESQFPDEVVEWLRRDEVANPDKYALMMLERNFPNSRLRR